MSFFVFFMGGEFRLISYPSIFVKKAGVVQVLSKQDLANLIFY